MHEEFIRGTLKECADLLQKRDLKSSQDASANNLKGEVTVVLAPVGNSLSKQDAELATEARMLQLLTKLRDDGVTRSEAVRLVVEMLQDSVDASKSPISKSEVYRVALTIPWESRSSGS